jgi:hypothetical protein
MQRDKTFRTAGHWGLASDGAQWVLQRRSGPNWQGISFVRSTRHILERCMREKGVEARYAEVLLEGLPDTYDTWKALQTAPEAS